MDDLASLIREAQGEEESGPRLHTAVVVGSTQTNPRCHDRRPTRWTRWTRLGTRRRRPLSLQRANRAVTAGEDLLCAPVRGDRLCFHPLAGPEKSLFGAQTRVPVHGMLCLETSTGWLVKGAAIELRGKPCSHGRCAQVFCCEHLLHRVENERRCLFVFWVFQQRASMHSTWIRISGAGKGKRERVTKSNN